jgi:hypothetical protein
MSENLKNEAKELGIENAGNLTPSQLKKAVDNAKLKQDTFNALKLRAIEFGIDIEGLSEEAIFKVVEEAESIAKEIKKQARDTEMLAFLSEYLGITDIGVLSQEEVKELLNERLSKESQGIEVITTQEGKCFESFTVNGKDYVFSDDAPAAFRYLGQHKTQEEWIADSDSIELMVAGNLSFLILKK